MLIDPYGRIIDYLRISVTDRCNLRCIYCMPAAGILHKPVSEILSFEKIHKIVMVAADLGIKKIRLTGGEPLVRRNLPELIKQLRSISSLKEITLTTNGIYLSNYVELLKKAGLDRINISLDTLQKEKYQRITRGGDLELVQRGIKSTLSLGFSAVKINTVLINGFNTDEILDFASLTEDLPLHIRFIEHMPTGMIPSFKNQVYFSCNQAREICSQLGRLMPVDLILEGTARVFRIEGFCGTIGFISPISEPFCSSCNKLRLTADGYLRNCLHSSKSINLKQTVDNDAQEKELAELIKQAVALKPASHNLLEEPLSQDGENFSMCQIGG